MPTTSTYSPTDQQSAILDHDPSHHARVLAGPGTGKSSTLLAYLDKLNALDPPPRTRMLTFTRATAAELAKKVQEDVGTAAVLTSTVHSFAISVLLANRGSANLPSPLRIADDWETSKLVYESIGRRLRMPKSRVEELFTELETNWQRLEPLANPNVGEGERKAFLAAWREDRRVYGYTLLSELPFALLEAMKQHDDLGGLDHDLLVIDEFQDLNACDLEVIQLVAARGCTVIAVGDDDQSIYSFRHAAPDGIRDFPSTYSISHDYPLSVSLRCGSRLIRWANEVIEVDPDRPKKPNLVPADSMTEGEIGLLRFRNGSQEVVGIRDLVVGLIDKEGLQPQDIAILMRSDRNGAFSRDIVNTLGAVGVPAYDPAEVRRLVNEHCNRRLMAMVRLLANNEDSLAWATLLELSQGVGSKLIDYIATTAREQGTSFGACLLSLKAQDFEGGPRSRRKAASYIDLVLNWMEEHTLPEEGDVRWGQWMAGVGDEQTASVASEEFVDLLLRLDGLDHETESLAQFVGQIEPLGKDMLLNDSEGVRLMTMSAAKGLTVKAAILVGVENEVIPHPKGVYSEERRLLYVAMTRATEFMFCTWAQRRSGPSARVGSESLSRRSLTEFLADASVESQSGIEYLRGKGWLATRGVARGRA